MAQESEKRDDPMILAADMWPCFGLKDPNDRLKALCETSGPAFSNLINSILLYDAVTIPTQDCLVMRVLVGQFGERGLIDCIEAGVVRFVRVRGSLGFAGSGGHVHGPCVLHTGAAFDGKSSDGRVLDPNSVPIEQCVDWMYSGMTETSDTSLLKRRILGATKDVELNSLIVQSVEATKRDLQSSELAQRFDAQAIKNGNLAELRAETIRLYESPHLKESVDDIDRVLDTVRVNLEFELANLSNCRDCSSFAPILEVTLAKEKRAKHQLALEQCCDLHEIADIPELGRGVAEDRVSIGDILKLRHSRDGSQFRMWFHENILADTNSVARAYVDLLRRQPQMDSIPWRIARFLITTSIGVLSPVLGTAIGAADSFMITPLLSRNRVKIFVDRLRTLGACRDDCAD